MKLSTRNRLPGTVTEVVKGEAAAKVTLQVGDKQMVALITRESADELGLEPRKRMTALVKATDVMVLTDGGGVAYLARLRGSQTGLPASPAPQRRG